MVFGQPNFESFSEIKPENRERKEREDIERIMELPLFDLHRMGIILTYLGEKPASLTQVAYNVNAPESEIKKELSKKEKIQKVLEQAGMKFEIVEKSEKTEEGVELKRYTFLIAKKEEVLEALKKAFELKDHETMGRLFGYPETAVEAFVKGEIISDYSKWWWSLPEEKRKDLEKEGIMNLLNFSLSKEHWEEELETLRRWQKVIKEKAPKLWEKLEKANPWKGTVWKEKEENFENKEK